MTLSKSNFIHLLPPSRLISQRVVNEFYEFLRDGTRDWHHIVVMIRNTLWIQEFSWNFYRYGIVPVVTNVDQ